MTLYVRGYPTGERSVSAECCHHEPADDARHRRILWAVLAINVVGFATEAAAGLAAGSASLQADALDFLGDAGNYAISLLVLGLAVRWRARAAMIKGGTMAVLGLWVVGSTVWYAVFATMPRAEIMGGVALFALALNAACLALLTRFRSGDANMRSVWICSRNDVIGNLAVLLAALGVFGTGTGWPDLLVAAVMGALALQGAWTVVRQAKGELDGHAREEGTLAIR